MDGGSGGGGGGGGDPGTTLWLSRGVVLAAGRERIDEGRLSSGKEID